MEKKVKIIKKGDDDSNLLYWLSLDAKERMRELVNIRQQVNERKYGTRKGFQRIFRIIKQA